MERARKVKFIIMITLMVAIAGMSLGFAAFSATLNVSSGASVTPNSSDFKVELCSRDTLNYCNDDMDMYVVYHYEYGGAKNNLGDVSGNYAWFEMTFTKPGQAVEYTFYAQNVGEYDAYLRSIFFESLDDGSYKRCSATTGDETKATDSLVQSACDGINVSVSINGVLQSIDPYGISGHKLEKQTVEEIVVRFEYAADAAYVDGPFEVEFGKMKFDYSTVDREVKIINFTIGGYSYQAEEGMTWLEWCNSDYNVDNFYISASGYVYASSNVMLNSEYVLSSDFISEDANYTFKSSGRPMPTPH